MSYRRTSLCALSYLASWLSVSGVVVAAREAAIPDTRPVLEITKDTVLDPAKTYGPIVIKASNITIDGRGAWVIGATQGNPKDYKGVGVSANGVSNVTLKDLNAKGWDIGLKVEHGSHWLLENCNFSDNFHYPEAGWDELGHHGGIVFEFVDHSTLRKNKANRVWDACMLANSDDNLVEDNDITHGGDGVFIRPYAGWTSSGNVFERNDASYANNNCFEAQCPRNTYRHNKANHGSHGIWVGLSNETIVENNVIRDNRWGIYMEFADWIDMAGDILENNRDGDVIKGGTDPGGNPLTFRWDFTDPSAFSTRV